MVHFPFKLRLLYNLNQDSSQEGRLKREIYWKMADKNRNCVIVESVKIW